ncbi:MAG: RNA-directed DNA polymerase, partial [Halobacteriovoraceae bacterium]|nr:RNA-directed DNA polymerase [Halobacteriovoraceae bacterium]
IYMNELDQFVKHKLKVSYYARYTDDFVIVSQSKEELRSILGPVREFLFSTLKLKLHPNKVSIRKLHNGVDFLGYIVLPHYKLMRTKTKRRINKGMLQKVKEYKRGKVDQDSVEKSLHSYLGALSHADTFRSREDLINLCWFLVND